MSTPCTLDKPASTVTKNNENGKTVGFTKPRYQATESEVGFQLSIEVPGVDKTGVTLKLVDEVLTVTAQRSDTVPNDWKPLVQELPQNDYRLRLRLNSKIDPDGIEAQLDNGILRVNLPIREQAKARVINIA